MRAVSILIDMATASRVRFDEAAQAIADAHALRLSVASPKQQLDAALERLGHRALAVAHGLAATIASRRLLCLIAACSTSCTLYSGQPSSSAV